MKKLNKEVSQDRKTKYRKKYYYSRLGRAFIIFLLVFMIVNIIVPTRSFSPIENRNLASRPSITAEGLNNGKYFEDWSTYYSDQFVLRDFFKKLTFRVEYLFGKREFNDVYIGKGGYLLQKPSAPDLDAVQKTAASLNAFSEKYKDLELYIGVVADAASILRDRLPANADVRDQESEIRSFYSAIDDNIMKVDMTEALAAKKDEYIFYKTDHHWTSYGAFQAFLAFAEDAMIDVCEYESYPVTKSFNGTLSAKTGDFRRSDTVEIYDYKENTNYYVLYTDDGIETSSLYVSDRLNENDKYQVFLGGNYPQIDIKTTANNEDRLLIFKDSYANCFVQFLIPYYEEIIIIDPRYYYGNVDTIITTKNITDILFLYTADTLFQDKTLSSALDAVFEDNSQIELTEEP